MRGQQVGMKEKIKRKKQSAAKEGGAVGIGKGGMGQLGEDGKVTLPPKLSHFIEGVGFLSVMGMTQKAMDDAHNKDRYRSAFEEGILNLWDKYRLIDPNHIYKIQWDLTMGLIIVYSLVTIPFRIGFNVSVSDQTKNFEYTIDILFFVDLLINFTTSYVDPITEKLVVDRKKIILTYFKFWFWIDFLSTVPFDALFSSATNLKSVRLIRILRLMRLAKLARFVKLSRLNSHFEKLDVNPALVNVVKIVTQIFFIAHLICCFWFYLTTSAVTGITEPPLHDPTYPIERTWATEFGYEHAPLFRKYVASFYWTIATMLAVGYGDIHATNNRERIYSIATMLCGGIMFGMVIAQVTRLIETRNPQARAYKEKMDEMKAFLGEKTLPTHVRMKAKEAYSYYLLKKSSIGDSGIFSNLPRPLLNRLMRNIYEKEINRIEMFRHGFKRGEASFIVSLVTKCHPLYHARSDIIYEMGDLASAMYFIVRGRIKLLDENRSGSSAILMGYATEGNFFGELEFQQKTVRLCSAVAAYNSNLLSLSYMDLRAALDEYLDSAKHFNGVVTHRYKNFKTVVASDSAQAHLEPSYAGSSIFEEAFGHIERRPSTTNLAKVVLCVNGRLELQLKSNADDDEAFFSVQDTLLRVVYVDQESNIEVIAEETLDMIWPHHYLLHPKGIFKIYWDTFIGLLILYSVIVIPVQIGFSSDGNQIWEHILDAFFFLDVASSARTSYFSEEDDAWVVMPDRIYRNYLSGWFPIDFFSSVPFDYIVSSVFSSSVMGLRSIKLLKTLRLTRLLKLVRLLKLGKYINQLEDMFGISPSAFDLMKMVVEVVFIGHLVACMWWGLSDLMTDEAWFDSVAMVYEPLRDAPLFTKYVTSLYWTFTTLATVGYGDIYAINSSERIVVIFVMILGATVFGYIVANVSSLMGNMNQTEVKNNEKLAEVTEYLNEKNCPKLLAGAIIRHNKFKLNEQSAFDEESIYSRLPQRIADEIQLHQYNELMCKIPMFNRMYIENQSIRLFIFKSLESEYFDTNQFLVQDGELAHCIHFIVSGRAMVYVLGEKKLRVKKRTTAEVFQGRMRLLRTRMQVVHDAKDWVKEKAEKTMMAAVSSMQSIRNNNSVKIEEIVKGEVKEDVKKKNIVVSDSSDSSSGSSSSSSSSSDSDSKKKMPIVRPLSGVRGRTHSSNSNNNDQNSGRVDISPAVSEKASTKRSESVESKPSVTSSSTAAPTRSGSNSQDFDGNKPLMGKKEDVDELETFLSNDGNFGSLQEMLFLGDSKSQKRQASDELKEANSCEKNENGINTASSERDQTSNIVSGDRAEFAPKGKPRPGSAERLFRPGSAEGMVRITRKTLRADKSLLPKPEAPISTPLKRESSAEFKSAKIISAAQHAKNLDQLKNSSDEDEVFITTNNITDNKTLYSIMDNRMQNRGYRPMGEVVQGDIVGYSAFLRRGRHTASIRTVEPCSVYTLSWKSIEGIIDAQPNVGLELQLALGLVIGHMSQDIGKMYSKRNRVNFLARQKAKHVAVATAEGGHVRKAVIPTGMAPLRHAVSMAGPAWGATMHDEYSTYHQGGHSSSHHPERSYAASGNLLDRMPSFDKLKPKPIYSIKSGASNAYSYLKSKTASVDSAYSEPLCEPLQQSEPPNHPSRSNSKSSNNSKSSKSSKREIRILKPNSKWHIVRNAIRDARITATIASINFSQKAPDTSGYNKKPHVFAKAMFAKVGGRLIDQVLNDKTIEYDSDDDSHKLYSGAVSAASLELLGHKNRFGESKSVGLGVSAQKSDSGFSKSATGDGHGQLSEAEREKLLMSKMYLIKRSKLSRCRSFGDLLTIGKDAFRDTGPFRQLHGGDQQQHFSGIPHDPHAHKGKEGSKLATTIRRRVSFPSLEIESWRSDTKMKICV